MINNDILMENLSKLNGNYVDGVGRVYITLKNIKILLKIIENSKELPNLLITPYLINLELDKIYELHYYEFEIDIGETIYFYGYPIANTLPLEITEKLAPRVVINKGNIDLYLEILRGYLNSMDSMEFETERQLEDLKNATLFYQIF